MAEISRLRVAGESCRAKTMTFLFLASILLLGESAFAFRDDRPTIVTQVNLMYAQSTMPTRHYVMGQNPLNDLPECRMVKAVVNGDIATVDQLLDAGLDINGVICLYENRPRSLTAGELMSDSVNNNARIFGRINTTLFAFSMTKSRIVPGTWVGIYDRNAREEGTLFTIGGGGVVYTLFGTPLMIACRMKNAWMVENLLKRGANPNVFVQQAKISDFTKCVSARPWYSPLRALYGTMEGATELATRDDARVNKIIVQLINAGLRFAPEDDMGRNALWDALEDCSPAVLKMAVNSGLNVNASDHQGKTFVDSLREFDQKCVGRPNARLVKKACREMLEFLKEKKLVPDDDKGVDDDKFTPVKLDASAFTESAVPDQPAGKEPLRGVAPTSSVEDSPSGISPAAPLANPVAVPIVGGTGGGYSSGGRRRCIGCGGTGKCQKCRGIGHVLEPNSGARIPCDKKCRACQGRGY